MSWAERKADAGGLAELGKMRRKLKRLELVMGRENHALEEVSQQVEHIWA